MKGIGKGLIVGVLAVCLSGTAQGQSSEDGTVAVHGLSVSRADDRLFVSMEMDISDLHVGRDRWWSLRVWSGRATACVCRRC